MFLEKALRAGYHGKAAYVNIQTACFSPGVVMSRRPPGAKGAGLHGDATPL